MGLSMLFFRVYGWFHDMVFMIWVLGWEFRVDLRLRYMLLWFGCKGGARFKNGNGIC